MENRRNNNNRRSQNKMPPRGTLNPHIKHGQFDNFLQVSPIPQYCLHLPNHVQCSCILEFDGASKGNPGQAGAGAVLRAANGSMMEFLEGGCPSWLTNNKKG
ncbi:hypothetical protein ACS0TY_032942 [Phlomoides rotata]